jgi:hypothetical protein
MDQESAIEQLALFSSNLVDVTKLLSGLSSHLEEEHREHVGRLVEVRIDLVNTIMMLNSFIGVSSTELEDEITYLGSLVMVPRFSNGSLFHDFGIVTKIVETSRLPELNNRSSETSSENVVSNTVLLKDGFDQVLSVAWVRPRSVFEFVSVGVPFSALQVSGGSQVLQYWKSLDQRVQNLLQIGDKVIFQNKDPNLRQSPLSSRAVGVGVWIPGEVVDRVHLYSTESAKSNNDKSDSDCGTTAHAGACSNACVIRLDSAGWPPEAEGAEGAEVGATCTCRTVVKKCTLADVAPVPPVPVPALVRPIAGQRDKQQAGSGGCSPAVVHAPDFDADCVADVGKMDGITSLPSYHGRHMVNKMMSVAVAAAAAGKRDQSEAIGAWQMHTKGIATSYRYRYR